MWWLSQLLSPLTYLRITQKDDNWYESRRLYDYILPIIFGLVTTAGYYLLLVTPAMLGPTGLFNSVSSLLQLLVAFFIAALAAVATFGAPRMDEPLRGKSAFLSKWDNNKESFVERELTRRQFVCYLFGYLSFVSLAMFLFIMIANAIAPTLTMVAPSYILHPAKAMVLFLFWSVFWNVIIATVLGIYFLSDRMQHDSD